MNERQSSPPPYHGQQQRAPPNYQYQQQYINPQPQGYSYPSRTPSPQRYTQQSSQTPPPPPYPQQQIYYTGQPSPAPYSGSGYYTSAQGYTQEQAMPKNGGRRTSLSMGDWSDDFNDAGIRRNFIRKVYCILSLQLLFVSTITAIFLLVEEVAKFSRENGWLVFVAFFMEIVFVIVLACCQSVCRSTPCNYIVLFLFTFANGYIIGVIATFYKAEHVLLAAGICTVVCFCLTLFAIQTKWDVTGCGMFALVALVVLMMFGIFLVFYKTKLLTIIYSSLAALIFSFYIVYDTQLLMGNRKNAISPEEYIWASLSLYIDITQLFLAILSLVSGGE